ncbi:AraC family transcriptional regulator [Mangrovicoccus algicola]|uniref:Helix-turn-helix transcriptional regulator n=1 Tax=Mangrovicoccus algicola TaxID=2771008 RepID=A0A8J6YZU6_9RHOB|nr:helix-turn-helix transcriptional regulator [Mangrovicoccus algicola]MBE3639021.1 helix-turn-helix transcriptional regulator [Mangrovicoccus algicola]
MRRQIPAQSLLNDRIALVEQAAAPLVALASDYAAGSSVAPHSHPRDQLMHAVSGVLHVRTAQGSWVVPPDCALWIPAGCVHAVEMAGPVSMRSSYLRPGATGLAADRPRVLAMSALARALTVEAGHVADIDRPDRRESLVMELLIAEIPRLPEQPLALPLPADPRLLRLCRAFLETPSARISLQDWADRAAMSRRSLTRHFRAETGLSPERWRQQACVLWALPRLLAGRGVTAIALELGYDSPAAFATMFRRLLGISPRDWRAGRDPLRPEAAPAPR